MSSNTEHQFRPPGYSPVEFALPYRTANPSGSTVFDSASRAGAPYAAGFQSLNTVIYGAPPTSHPRQLFPPASYPHPPVSHKRPRNNYEASSRSEERLSAVTDQTTVAGNTVLAAGGNNNNRREVVRMAKKPRQSKSTSRSSTQARSDASDAPPPIAAPPPTQPDISVYESPSFPERSHLTTWG
ncbi:hypothetical protein MKZ38_008792 [Zalerion maritima]|uniref:Uncharacterized protein n=1 Tax=Zalerion maritima TaxID=339359 RepID=A0AAD5RH97_9PEZI|nr:hypothetical protein MKZ38_008792 [Zalerion maritima]